MAAQNLVPIFGKFMDHFEGIEFQDFITLQPEHIREAIPNLVPRIKFENLFKNFMLNRKNETLMEFTVENDTVLDASSPPNENENYISSVEPTFDESSFTFTTVPTTTSKCLLNSSARMEGSQYIKTAQDIIDIPNIDLKIVITNNISRNLPIENCDRVIIGKAIIHQLLVNDFERVISKDEFFSLAKLIVELFPQELLGTYYIPAVQSQQAQGKLYSAYQNFKAQLREAGLATKRTKALTTPTNNERVQLAEKSEAFKILLEESDDFDRIVECWNFCFAERQQLLTELSVFEYISKFPAFNLPNGIELLTLDANKLIGSVTSQLSEIAPKIILYASRKKRNSLEIKNLLIGLKESLVNLDVDKVGMLQQLTAIKLLPHVMPAKKKLSKSEISNLFCPYFKTETEADQKNAEFKENYKEDSLILKPRLYFFGDSLSPRAQIYLADKKYFIENSLIGFEAAFKSFVGLNCKYPEETEHLWHFIQSEIYGIKLGSVKISSTQLTFVEDIKKIIVG